MARCSAAPPRASAPRSTRRCPTTPTASPWPRRSRTTCCRAPPRCRRSGSSTWRRPRPTPASARRASARAAPSGRPRRSPTRSTTRWRRSARSLRSCRSRRSASSRRWRRLGRNEAVSLRLCAAEGLARGRRVAGQRGRGRPRARRRAIAGANAEFPARAALDADRDPPLGGVTRGAGERRCRDPRRLRHPRRHRRWPHARCRPARPCGHRGGHRLSRRAKPRHHRRQPRARRSRCGLALHADRARCLGADVARRRWAQHSARGIRARALPDRAGARRDRAGRAHPAPVGGRALGLLQGLPQTRRVRVCHGGGAGGGRARGQRPRRPRAAPAGGRPQARAGAGGDLMRLSLTVNGSEVAAEVEPRTSLADFLRESRLLTGTHIGCEHGICGACTLLLDGEPVRSCITFAVECEGRDVRSIEGLNDDPVAVALRAAFSAEHALQCGYCTPGMLVTARDIVLRIPDADEERIRLELSGNLCRCTGYVGIVRAIRRVLEDPPEAERPARAKLPAGRFAVAAETASPTSAAPVPQAVAPGDRLTQRIRLGLPRDAVWRAVQDPALVAGCVPGAHILSQEGGRIRGEILASLGPIRARFAGEAVVTYDDARYAGRLTGEGRDAATGTRLSGDATFRVTEDGPGVSVIELEIAYALRGALAQFGRGPIVQVFARELAETTGRNLETTLRGEAAPLQPPRLSMGALAMRAVWRWIRDLLTRRTS